jgi:hypothetical protein
MTLCAAVVHVFPNEHVSDLNIGLQTAISYSMTRSCIRIEVYMEICTAALVCVMAPCDWWVITSLSEGHTAAIFMVGRSHVILVFTVVNTCLLSYGAM